MTRAPFYKPNKNVTKKKDENKIKQNKTNAQNTKGFGSTEWTDG